VEDFRPTTAVPAADNLTGTYVNNSGVTLNVTKLGLPVPIASGGTGAATQYAAALALTPPAGQIYATSAYGAFVRFPLTAGSGNYIMGSIVIGEAGSSGVGQARIDFALNRSSSSSVKATLVYNTLPYSVPKYVYAGTDGSGAFLWIRFQNQGTSQYVYSAFCDWCTISSYAGTGAPLNLVNVYPTVTVLSSLPSTMGNQGTLLEATPVPIAVDVAAQSNVNAAGLYVRRVGSMVFIDGMVVVSQPISADNALLIATIDSTYAPPHAVHLPCQYEATVGWVIVSPGTGQITIYMNPDAGGYNGSTYRFNGAYSLV
jgi:hypothetical protein